MSRRDVHAILTDMDIPLSAEEAAKRARGEIWLGMSGGMYQAFHPPKELHSYVRIDSVRGSLLGRRVIRQDQQMRYWRGLYVCGDPQLGSQLPDAPSAETVYLPVVPEEVWWAHKIVGTPLVKVYWASVLQVWLDEAEDPTPR